MQHDLKSEIDPIINLKCCSASVGYGGILILGFGDLIEHDHPKLKNNFHGEWEIRTNSASWRILKGNELVVGDYDDELLIKEGLYLLLGKRLINSWLQSINSDIKFIFENNIICEIFSTSRNEYSWELDGPSINIEIQANSPFKKIGPEFVECLNQSEQFISIHSEDCSQRWKSIIPKRSEKNKCDNCCYYRHLQGQYYFWDYGLCSNAKSLYDGKVVNVGSGCEEYGTEIKNT